MNDDVIEYHNKKWEDEQRVQHARRINARFTAMQEKEKRAKLAKKTLDEYDELHVKEQDGKLKTDFTQTTHYFDIKNDVSALKCHVNRLQEDSCTKDKITKNLQNEIAECKNLIYQQSLTIDALKSILPKLLNLRQDVNNNSNIDNPEILLKIEETKEEVNKMIHVLENVVAQQKKDVPFNQSLRKIFDDARFDKNVL